MHVILIVAPVFALIAIGYAASRSGILSDGASKILGEFAFGIAIPALLFRTVATATFPEFSPVGVWAAFYGALVATWLAATLTTALVLRRPAADGIVIAIGSVYGNLVMLGIPLSIGAYGHAAAAPMALLLSVNTPLLWLVGSLLITWAERRSDGTVTTVLSALAADLARNPIVLGILAGLLLRSTGLGLHPLLDKVLSMLAEAAVPTALVALGISLRSFRIDGQLPTLTVMCLLKLVMMPALAWFLAIHVLELPQVAAGVVVIFAATPAGANVFIFANRFGKVVHSASGAVALGTLLSMLTATVFIAALLSRAP